MNPMINDLQCASRKPPDMVAVNANQWFDQEIESNDTGIAKAKRNDSFH